MTHRLAVIALSALVLHTTVGGAQTIPDSTRREIPVSTDGLSSTSTTGNRSTVDDLIAATRSALNDLKYDDAIELAHEALIQKRLRRSQSVVISQLLGAAFYPDPEESTATPRLDSAMFYLRRAVKLQPDATLPEDIRWRGLDSLYQAVRANTFAAVAQPAGEYALTGVDGRAFIEVISAKPAHMWLRTVNRREGTVVMHDSVRGATRARMAMRAHDGERPLFIAGEYELQIVVADAGGTAVDTLRYSALAFGVPPVLEAPPVFPAHAVRPERARRAIVAGVGAGVFVGGLTVALARYARHDNAIKSSVAADGRATSIGVLTLLGGIVGGILDRGKPLPDNVRSNAELRANHVQAVAAIENANRRKVGEYKVELRIDGETPR